MQKNSKFNNLFGNKPILGMLHLAGEDPVKRALEEMTIFEEEGVDGAIVENYHGSVEDVIKTLNEIKRIKPSLIIGVNILPNEYYWSFQLAKQYGVDFIQLDHVAGKYMSGELDSIGYSSLKEKFKHILVLGGVWPKYYHPVEGSDLEKDLIVGIQRSEAIVVTGEGTGKETPIDKIIRFREIMGNHPLIIGAGLTPSNIYEQLRIADGAIVGTYFKVDGDTSKPVDRMKVSELMDIVKEIRRYR